MYVDDACQGILELVRATVYRDGYHTLCRSKVALVPLVRSLLDVHVPWVFLLLVAYAGYLARLVVGGVLRTVHYLLGYVVAGA